MEKKEKDITSRLEDLHKKEKDVDAKNVDLGKMIEEEKMAHLHRMKILTHWRKLLRLAKTEQLKKEIQIYQ